MNRLGDRNKDELTTRLTVVLRVAWINKPEGSFGLFPLFIPLPSELYAVFETVQGTPEVAFIAGMVSSGLLVYLACRENRFYLIKEVYLISNGDISVLQADNIRQLTRKKMCIGFRPQNYNSPKPNLRGYWSSE